MFHSQILCYAASNRTLITANVKTFFNFLIKIENQNQKRAIEGKMKMLNMKDLLIEVVNGQRQNHEGALAWLCKAHHLERERGCENKVWKTDRGSVKLKQISGQSEDFLV